jgi:hypothetical protein
MISETCGVLMIVLGLVGLVCSLAARDYLEQPVLRRARRMAGRRAARKVVGP